MTHIYEATKNREHLEKAINIWRSEIDEAKKLEKLNQVAELYWEIANARDTLGEHDEAAESFQQSSDYYRRSAEKIPQLREFYSDYTKYMQAWSELEQAKQCHSEKRYVASKDHYESAAKIFGSTEPWRYLVPNYQAWARLEEAEALSRGEQTEKAKEIFDLSTNMFEEVRRETKAKLENLEKNEREALYYLEHKEDLPSIKEGAEVGKTRGVEERDLLAILIQESEVRRDYCLGRSALEEAKLHSRQGDYEASRGKYALALKTFERIAEKSKGGFTEIEPLIYLCKAWQTMAQAEGEESPEIYHQASRLFEEAKDRCTDDTSKKLSLGHSHLCLALEGGIKFERSRDPTLYPEVTRNLENAANLYAKAGLEEVSNYVKGTQRFYNSYIYMDNASSEVDPGKKAKFYMMAERLLESSAESYRSAKFQKKSEEVEMLLKRVKEDRELAVSLNEVLNTSAVISNTNTFTAPMHTEVKATGLAQFETANVQAELILDKSEAQVGEDVNLEFELVNAGRKPAKLLRIENVIPVGFIPCSTPETCRVEDTHLNMRGKVLQPLVSESVKLVLKPLARGAFNLKPRIIYVDEAGSTYTADPRGMTLTVRELGISHWLKGPGRQR